MVAQLAVVVFGQGFNPNDDPYNGLAGNQGSNMFIFRKRGNPINMNRMMLARAYNNL